MLIYLMFWWFGYEGEELESRYLSHILKSKEEFVTTLNSMSFWGGGLHVEVWDLNTDKLIETLEYICDSASKKWIEKI